MTENNAIKEIVKETCSGCYGSDAEPFRCKKCGYKTAIDALEEIQAYRALGTIEEIKHFFNENRKAGYKHGYSDGYAKAIDEFLKKICKKYTEEESKGNYKQYCCNIKQELAEIAEQMKGGDVE